MLHVGVRGCADKLQTYSVSTSASINMLKHLYAKYANMTMLTSLQNTKQTKI